VDSDVFLNSPAVQAAVHSEKRKVFKPEAGRAARVLTDPITPNIVGALNE